MKTPGQDAAWFRDQLSHWYREQGRDFPWRRTEDFYQRLICEVLLRRSRGTTVATVVEPLFQRWPTASELGAADVCELIDVIRPLGLLQRAHQLITLGRELSALERDPDAVEELTELTGVGPYTAAATLGAPAVDGTSARVYRRFFGLHGNDDQHKTVDQPLWDLVRSVAPTELDQTRELNWAVLDLAATVCSPRRPKCDHCPLQSRCRFAASATSPRSSTG